MALVYGLAFETPLLYKIISFTIPMKQETSTLSSYMPLLRIVTAGKYRKAEYKNYMPYLK